eukprot:2655429-Pyramimonas_sp.AAC.1
MANIVSDEGRGGLGPSSCLLQMAGTIDKCWIAGHACTAVLDGAHAAPLSSPKGATASELPPNV